MQEYTGEGSLEMKIPNICSVCACFNLKTSLLSGQVIHGMVAKETEKAVSCFTKDQETQRK